MLVVEVQGYGDFDILRTEALFYHPDMNKKSSFNVSSLGDFGNDKTPDRLIAALKKAGFKPLHSQQITFGGNY